MTREADHRMNTLTDGTGAQILPPAEDSRATVTAWFAYVSADGDQRTKYPEWSALAGTLYPQIGASS